MKAAIYEQFGGPISISSVTDPKVPEKGVVLKVEASGLCLSDWHGWMGHDPDIRLPHVPGHELAGTIVEIGPGIRKWRVGQRVTVPFVSGCGKCSYCLSGDQQVCDHQFQPGFTAWGSFAEYVALAYAEENLVALPEDINFSSAASLGCRFITAYRAIRDQGKLKEGQYVGIHGCGGVGLSGIQIAKVLNAVVIAVDISDEKCAMASALGADLVINARKTSVVDAIQTFSKGGVHLSIDALGHTETCLNSIKSLRKRGKHIQVGLMTGTHTYPAIPMSLIIANELEILGSHGMQAHRYQEMFDFIQNSTIDLAKMIAESIPLDSVPQLLPELNTRKEAGITVIEF